MLPVDGIRLGEDVERFGEFVAGDFVAVDVEAGEEGAVEDAADGFGACLVQLMRVVEQVKGCQEDLPPYVELAGGLVKLAGDLLLFFADGRELGPQLVLGPALFGGQVEKIAFFFVEFVELPGELLAEFVAQLEVLGDGVCNSGSYLCLEIFGQDDHVLVMLRYRLFHDIDGYVGVVALLLLSAPAEEVEVGAAVAPSRHNGEAVLAAVAPDQTLEIVGVLAFSCAATRVGVEEALHAVEECFANERLMSALVFNALVGEFADVVAAPQHAS